MKSRNRRATARRSAEDGLSVLMMTDRKGENMERLTQRSTITGNAVPSKQLGDICLLISGCEEYDFCEDCPIREMLTRLCEYEDTGLTPEQINHVKEIFLHSPKPSTENERVVLPVYTCNKEMITSAIGKLGVNFTNVNVKVSD
ncbi:hypothetical protein SAMN02910436_02265 [Ruminococcaceae bacterium P7]|nr:hypothetical protein SAMN02910436_02265 [Ruminococcaceae bacterium P7]